MERIQNVFGTGAQYKPINFLIFQSQGSTKILLGFHTVIVWNPIESIFLKVIFHRFLSFSWPFYQNTTKTNKDPAKLTATKKSGLIYVYLSIYI